MSEYRLNVWCERVWTFLFWLYTFAIRRDHQRHQAFAELAEQYGQQSSFRLLFCHHSCSLNQLYNDYESITTLNSGTLFFEFENVPPIDDVIQSFSKSSVIQRKKRDIIEQKKRHNAVMFKYEVHQDKWADLMQKWTLDGKGEKKIIFAWNLLEYRMMHREYHLEYNRPFISNDTHTTEETEGEWETTITHITTERKN